MNTVVQRRSCRLAGIACGAGRDACASGGPVKRRGSESISDRLSGSLLPILALLALLAAGAQARAADDNNFGQGQYTAFGAQADPQSRRAAAMRIYVPLHAAQPHEVGVEFAPIQATAFGGARSGQAPAGTPSGTAAGKPPAGRDLGFLVSKNNGIIVQSVEAPSGQ